MTINEATHWWLFLNTSIIILSGTMVAIYQRYIEVKAKRRESLREQHAKDVAAGFKTVISENKMETKMGVEEARKAFADMNRRLDLIVESQGRLEGILADPGARECENPT